MQDSPAAPNLPPFVDLDPSIPALPAFKLDSPIASAILYQHGAHLAAWSPHSRHPVLFISRQSHLAPAKPIRGGVPVCFPWFATRTAHPDSPSHGFLRTAPWQLDALSTTPDGTLRAELRTYSNGQTRHLWPGEFQARFRLTAGVTLAIELEITNSGSEAFLFEEALHTYFSVSDARSITIRGLENALYVDKVEGGALKAEGASPISLSAETDRVYHDTQSTITLSDPAWHREIVIEKFGSDTTVLWNPWSDKAKAMADLGDDEWLGMVCIETANVGKNSVTLQPGAIHSMIVRVAVRETPA
jgi:glucose-6-phosphate 1-epimerase